MTDEEERELARQAAQGDQAAADRLKEKVATPVGGMLRALLQAAGAADGLPVGDDVLSRVLARFGKRELGQ